MVEMTKEERKVADFLTRKKFKWEFQPSVSVKDLGGRTRLFSPDFYLIDLNIYIEVCGAERNEHYERTKEIYWRNKIPIIYVETYKSEDSWQYFLIQRIKEIQENRQKIISPIKNLQTDSRIINKRYEKISNEISNHIDNIKKSERKELRLQSNSEEYTDNSIISYQSQMGILLTFLGLILLIIPFIIRIGDAMTSFFIVLIGLCIFLFGMYIAIYRFKRWFSDWYASIKKNFRSWLEK